MTFLREYLNERSVQFGACRLWCFSITDGYGSAHWKGKAHKAHRLSWMEANGGHVPAGMSVCHTCDTRHCIEPAHLWLGTNAENTADRHAKGRSNAPRGATHPRARLTEKDVRSIRDDRRSNPIIAAEYGVQKAAIAKIKRRENWASIS